MAGGFSTLDLMFPQFTGTEGVNDKIAQILDYQYMLLKWLKYALGNLDSGNFNSYGLQNITEPIYARIEDAEKGFTEIIAGPEGLTIQVNELGNRCSILEQRSDGITLAVRGVEGVNYLQLKDGKGVFVGSPTAITLDCDGDGLSIKNGNLVLGAKKSITVGTLNGKLVINGGGVKLSAADGLPLTLASGEGSGLQLKAGTATIGATCAISIGTDAGGLYISGDGVKISANSCPITLSVQNNGLSSAIAISSGDITLASGTVQITGAVTFNDLAMTGATQINGANITTGQISCERIDLYGRMSVFQNNAVGAYSGKAYLWGNTIYCKGNSLPPVDISLKISGSVYNNGECRVLNSRYEPWTAGEDTYTVAIGVNVPLVEELAGAVKLVWGNVGGYLGYMQGQTLSSPTYGMGFADNTEKSIVMATNAGARLTHIHTQNQNMGTELCAQDSNAYMKYKGAVNDTTLEVGAGSAAVVWGSYRLTAAFLNNSFEMYTNSYNPLLGRSDYPWYAVYTENLVTSSDRRLKEDIRQDIGRYSAFFDALAPCSFVYLSDPSGRRRLGLIAQEVEAALASCGLSASDFAGLIVPEDEDGYYGLDYTAFVPLLIAEVQRLKAGL